jgi:hypothetical protein
MSAKPYEKEVLFGIEPKFKVVKIRYDKTQNIDIFYLEEITQ